MHSQNSLIVADRGGEIAFLLLVDGAAQKLIGRVFLPEHPSGKQEYQREETSEHRPQNSLEWRDRMRDNGGFVGPAMKTKSAVFLLVLFSFTQILGRAAKAQGIPAGGGTSTITRPDSLQDLGYYGY